MRSGIFYPATSGGCPKQIQISSIFKRYLFISGGCGGGSYQEAFIEFEHKNFILEHVDTVILDNRTEALIHKPSGSFQKRDGKLNFYEFSKSSFELNQDQFLRKASKDVYVLNEQKGSHWEVNPIVRKSAREVYVLYLKKEDIPSDFKRLENGEVDVSWTKKEILQKI
ncbi:MAG: hypothetical protein LPJ98_13625, partial [Cyclobacteriaceae bacterium]|nr:hypothetical protein [Cyclobacteriaceae bacterium]